MVGIYRWITVIRIAGLWRWRVAFELAQSYAVKSRFEETSENGPAAGTLQYLYSEVSEPCLSDNPRDSGYTKAKTNLTVTQIAVFSPGGGLPVRFCSGYTARSLDFR